MPRKKTPTQPTTAEQYLRQAAEHLSQRGKTYDQPGGERSAAKTAAAFNAITGRDLSAADVWLMLLLLKLVRQNQTPNFHRDSAEDAVAYSALMAEQLTEGN